MAVAVDPMAAGVVAFTAAALLREERVPTAVAGMAADRIAHPAMRVVVPLPARDLAVTLIARRPEIPLRDALALRLAPPKPRAMVNGIPSVRRILSRQWREEARLIQEPQQEVLPAKATSFMKRVRAAV